MFGQGDATLITTPLHKHILIDGGGSEFSDFDVGKNTLMPYLLDRKIAVLDYIIISHFDTDHCGSAIYLMENMKVKNVIIGKQFEENQNLEEFIKILKEKNINLIVVEMGDKINIERDINFDILWPNENQQITNNSINNNAVVMKLNYENKENFSMLFTGDIEEEAEKELVKQYSTNNINQKDNQNNSKNYNNDNIEKNKLKSTILKVAHHGSKSSTTEEFLKIVEPKIALIGVGENNLYGHPADETIKKLEDERSKNI